MSCVCDIDLKGSLSFFLFVNIKSTGCKKYGLHNGTVRGTVSRNGTLTRCYDLTEIYGTVYLKTRWCPSQKQISM